MILTTSLFLLGALPSLNAEVVQEAKLHSSRGFNYVQKIKVEDHTYLYLIYAFNPRCNIILHDPNCSCEKSKEVQVCRSQAP